MLVNEGARISACLNVTAVAFCLFFNFFLTGIASIHKLLDHCVIRNHIKLYIFSSHSSAQQTAAMGLMCSIIITKHEELTAVTCPWRSVEVLQSILIGQDMETRVMFARLIFKGVKCHRSSASTETLTCHR